MGIYWVELDFVNNYKKSPIVTSLVLMTPLKCKVIFSVAVVEGKFVFFLDAQDVWNSVILFPLFEFKSRIYINFFFFF